MCESTRSWDWGWWMKGHMHTRAGSPSSTTQDIMGGVDIFGHGGDRLAAVLHSCPIERGVERIVGAHTEDDIVEGTWPWQAATRTTWRGSEPGYGQAATSRPCSRRSRHPCEPASRTRSSLRRGGRDLAGRGEVDGYICSFTSIPNGDPVSQSPTWWSTASSREGRTRRE